MNNTTISRGEVYYISSKNDTIGSEQRSGRPAVIVSNNANNSHSECVEVCYLTLQEKTPLPTHIKITQGICFNSTVLCEQVTTISKERIGDYMCRLSDSTMEKIDEALIVSLGIDYISYCSDGSSDVNAIKKLQANIKCLEEENRGLVETCDSLRSMAEKADMYEKMYNDLLDRLMRR